jgi:sortase B
VKKRKILMIVLAAVFAVSAGMLIYELSQYRKGQEIYTEAEELVDLPNFEEIEHPDVSADSEETQETQETPVYIDPYAEQLKNMDFSALREVNPEVLGWILIPGTVVSYPFLQTDNNSYYLTHTWKTWTSIVGSIFLEYQNRSDFSDFNTVIYGHNMNNGSMFGTLKKYKSQSYWRSHPTVYITDNSGSRAYKIFAAYEVSTIGSTYQIGFPSEQSRQDFLNFCMDQSVISTGVVPTVNDHIITLSTCTGRGHATRWVVQAVLKSTAASDQAEPALPEPPTSQPQEPDASVLTPDSSAAGSTSAEETAPEQPTADTSATPENGTGEALLEGNSGTETPNP